MQLTPRDLVKQRDYVSAKSTRSNDEDKERTCFNVSFFSIFSFLYEPARRMGRNHIWVGVRVLCMCL